MDTPWNIIELVEEKLRSHGFFMVFSLLRSKRPATAVAVGIYGETGAEGSQARRKDRRRTRQGFGRSKCFYRFLAYFISPEAYCKSTKS